jgi:hypothetical protein
MDTSYKVSYVFVMPKTTKKKEDLKPEKRQATIYFQTELLKKLKHYCIDSDLDMSTVVDRAVREFLSKHGKK